MLLLILILLTLTVICLEASLITITWRVIWKMYKLTLSVVLAMFILNSSAEHLFTFPPWHFHALFQPLPSVQLEGQWKKAVPHFHLSVHKWAQPLHSFFSYFYPPKRAPRAEKECWIRSVHSCVFPSIPQRDVVAIILTADLCCCFYFNGRF